MVGFKFSLEPVLSYQESLVELHQMELATLEHEARQARSVRDGLIAEIGQNHVHLQGLLRQGRLDVGAVARAEVYHQDLSARLEQQQAVVADVEARVASKRTELLKTQQDRDMLQALRRRQLRRFEESLEQAEAQLIDESAIAGFNRRRMAPARRPTRREGDNADVE